MKIISLFVLFLYLSGCATFESVSYQDVRQKSQKINAEDGISREEAIVLAQHVIINKGLGDRLYTLKPFDVDHDVVYSKNGHKFRFVILPENLLAYSKSSTWKVLFRDREGSQMWGMYPVIPFYVEVNGESGEILRWGLKTDYVKD